MASMAEETAANGDPGSRPRGQTTAAVEDSETWVESKRFTVYKVKLMITLDHDRN